MVWGSLAVGSSCYEKVKSQMLYSLIKKVTPAFLKAAATDLAWKRVGLVTELPSGLKVQINSPGEWYVFNEVFVNKLYDGAIQKAIELSSESRNINVLDLGANVGYFTLRLFDLLQDPKRAYAVLVEGVPSVHKELEQRLRGQPLPQENIRILNGLVGRVSNKGLINVNKHPVNSSIFDRSETVKKVAVDFVDLNLLFDTINLLKCDIEGAELLFLENYTTLLSKTKVAIFELHHELCDANRCLLLLSQVGFSNHNVLIDTPALSLHMFWRDIY